MESKIGNRWDAFFGVIIGLFLILITPRIWKWSFTGDSGWTFTDEAGNPMAYTKSLAFWGDLAFALFDVALIAEGLVLAFRRTRPFLACCFVITVLATLSNLAYVIYMINRGMGFQIFSGLATAFGLYIAGYQWSLLGSRSLE
ncbi:MAG: hypothetical protein JO353_00710 [Phycisphaerae bacterium]|nr:hypothetical protein [Phycisphaerae bacterium]